METVAKLTKEERNELFRATADKKGVTEALIEKDFWVCLLLKTIFENSELKELLIFKGGTSLSKCYNLINRFSEDVDLILIENVGNLICPSEFALGEHKRVVISSLPEGDDKPLKYPMIFTDADVVIINKMDLLPYVDFDIAAFRRSIEGLNPGVQIFEVSCKSGAGIENWCSWLSNELKQWLLS